MKNRLLFRAACLLLALLFAAGLAACAPASDRALLDYQERLSAVTMRVAVNERTYTLEMTVEHGEDAAKTTAFTVTEPQSIAGMRFCVSGGTVTLEAGDAPSAPVLSGENSPLACLAEAFALRKEWLSDAQSTTEDGVLCTKLTFIGTLQSYVLTTDDGGLPKRIEFETAHANVRADITHMELDENG